MQTDIDAVTENYDDTGVTCIWITVLSKYRRVYRTGKALHIRPSTDTEMQNLIVGAYGYLLQTIGRHDAVTGVEAGQHSVIINHRETDRIKDLDWYVVCELSRVMDVHPMNVQVLIEEARSRSRSHNHAR